MVFHIEKGDLLHDYQHPNQQRYTGQRLTVIGIDKNGYLVPYVESEDEIIPKAIIPSRKALKNILEDHVRTKLSKEENKILKSFEDGEWVPVPDSARRKKELIQHARNTLKKDKRLNIRISERDLVELQRKAVKEGLPYQTYVSSIIHKFISGTLVEVSK